MATFDYVGGDMSVDLVNTADWPDDAVGDELLTDYGRLIEWAVGAGAISEAQAARFRRAATHRPRDATAALSSAHRLRRVLRTVFAGVIAGVTPKDALAELGAMLPPRQLAASPTVHWEWVDADAHLDSPLWPVVWSAVTLLTSADARRLRECGSAGCGWMFIDRSRNHLRRWCDMAACGNLEKSRRRARRSPGRSPARRDTSDGSAA